MLNKKITYFFCSICLLMTSIVYSQKSIPYELVGTIKLIDNSIISYKLSFSEFEDGSIKGKSITDFAGEHRTESALVGHIDRDKNTITFSEKSNLLTKSNVASEDFCFVHVYNAKMKIKREQSIIQGHFYSRYADGSKCIEGDIYLVGDQMFLEKMKDLSKKKLLPKKQKKIIKDLTAKSEEGMSRTVLTEGQTLTVRALNDDIMIRLWDDEHIDGDRISVYRDEKLILDNYAVKKAQKQLLIPIIKDTTEIRIIATNEGRIPPNSAKFAIVNSNINVPITIRLNEGKEAKFVVVKD